MNQLKEISTNDLEDMRDELEIKIATIKSQVDLAKSEAKSQGEYSDIHWFNKAKHALRMSGQQHQFIIRELAKRNKKERSNSHNSVENLFVNIAKRKLNEITFKEILAEAVDAHEQQA